MSAKIRYEGEEIDRKVFESFSPSKYKAEQRKENKSYFTEFWTCICSDCNISTNKTRCKTNTGKRKKMF